ncbi:hypothetical protein LTR66_015395, partial [Elasticomyces elasticus]
MDDSALFKSAFDTLATSIVRITYEPNFVDATQPDERSQLSDIQGQLLGQLSMEKDNPERVLLVYLILKLARSHPDTMRRAFDNLITELRGTIKENLVIFDYWQVSQFTVSSQPISQMQDWFDKIRFEITRDVSQELFEEVQ